jgi:hypothetical protein
MVNSSSLASNPRSNVISKIPMLKADIHRLSPVDLPPTLPPTLQATLLFEAAHELT